MIQKIISCVILLGVIVFGIVTSCTPSQREEICQDEKREIKDAAYMINEEKEAWHKSFLECVSTLKKCDCLPVEQPMK